VCGHQSEALLTASAPKETLASPPAGTVTSLAAGRRVERDTRAQLRLGTEAIAHRGADGGAHVMRDA
jgi:hypothetical protein